MTHTILDLRGLRCPMPVLRTRQALLAAEPGATFAILCTDPMSALDIPNLLRETGDRLDGRSREGDVLTFRATRAGPGETAG